jgi:beta-aspartyl-peptidase (threonine type)
MIVSLRMALALALAVAAVLAIAVAPGGRGTGQEARAADPQERVHDVVFAIHGGAGTIRHSDLTPEQERAYREALTTALEAGRDVLRDKGDATAAVKWPRS